MKVMVPRWSPEDEPFPFRELLAHIILRKSDRVCTQNVQCFGLRQDISKTCILMKSFRDIHSFQRMNLFHFLNSVNFYLFPSSGKVIVCALDVTDCGEISPQVLPVNTSALSPLH